MANIEKRNGTYRVKVRLKGHPTENATFQTLTEAKRWAQRTEAAIREGRYFPSTEAKRHTLADLIDKYALDILPHKSPSSVYMQNQQLTYWKKHLGDYALSAITPGMLAEHRDSLARTRKNSTVRRYLAALSHVFTIAVKEYQWLNENPCQKIRKPPEPRGRVRFLSDNERQRLLGACKASASAHLYTIVVLALSTGARKMELCSLTWQHVNLKRATITIDDSKNGERRTLPLAGFALNLMRQHAKVRRLDTPLVFPSPDGHKPLDIRSAWETVVQRANLEDFHFHDLRHSAASYMLMNGASLGEIAEILGHRSVQVTRRYSHLAESSSYKIVAAMNAAIFGE